MILISKKAWSPVLLITVLSIGPVQARAAAPQTQSSSDTKPEKKKKTDEPLGDRLSTKDIQILDRAEAKDSSDVTSGKKSKSNHKKSTHKNKTEGSSSKTEKPN